jgi:hypothetical protein
MMRRAIVLLGFCAMSLLVSPLAHAGMCPMIYKPVCGLLPDGKRATFGNSCEAGNMKARILHQGACEAGTMCFEIYKPVCAINPATGKPKTYANSCFAEMANAVSVGDGACK